MTEADKIAIVKLKSNETDDAIISVALLSAGEELAAAFGIHDETERTEFLDRYGAVHANAAAYYLNKRGWDFQTGHSENGVSRQFETGGLPDSILRMIPPQAKVFS